MMVQYAPKRVIVQKADDEKDGTIIEVIDDVNRAIERTSNMGISPWIHPILFFPSDPIIMVEGKYDNAFFDEALRILRPKRKIRVTYLGQLKGGDNSGGEEATYRYVKANKEAIKSRIKEAPVIVVLDWDVKTKKGDKSEKFAKLFTRNDPFYVHVWPSSTFNPNLDSSFRGIERHYSDRMIELAESRGAIIHSAKDKPCTIAQNHRENLKEILYQIVKEGLKDEDLEYSRSFLQQIINIAEGKKPNTMLL